MKGSLPLLFLRKSVADDPVRNDPILFLTSKKKKYYKVLFFLFLTESASLSCVCKKKKVPHSLLSFVFSCWWAESVESSAGVFGGRGAVVACQCVSRPLDSKLFSRAHSHTRLSADSLPVPNCVSVCVCVRVVPCNNVFLRF